MIILSLLYYNRIYDIKNPFPGDHDTTSLSVRISEVWLYLKLVEATQKGEKLKQGCDYPGDRIRDLAHPPMAAHWPNVQSLLLQQLTTLVLSVSVKYVSGSSWPINLQIKIKNVT